MWVIVHAGHEVHTTSQMLQWWAYLVWHQGTHLTERKKQLLSEIDLREMAALFVPNIIQREDDEIDFEHLKISQDFVLTHWTFVARTIGKGEEYPKLSLIIPEGLAYTQKHTENTNCTDTIYPNVYQCSVAPETVRAGDIVALVLPPLSRARVALVFILNGAQPGKRIVDGAQVEGFPLFALEIGSNPFLASQPCLVRIT
jgi:hypothetical protein